MILEWNVLSDILGIYFLNSRIHSKVCKRENYLIHWIIRSVALPHRVFKVVNGRTEVSFHLLGTTNISFSGQQIFPFQDNKYFLFVTTNNSLRGNRYFFSGKQIVPSCDNKYFLLGQQIFTFLVNKFSHEKQQMSGLFTTLVFNNMSFISWIEQAFLPGGSGKGFGIIYSDPKIWNNSPNVQYLNISK